MLTLQTYMSGVLGAFSLIINNLMRANNVVTNILRMPSYLGCAYCIQERFNEICQVQDLMWVLHYFLIGALLWKFVTETFSGWLWSNNQWISSCFAMNLEFKTQIQSCSPSIISHQMAIDEYCDITAWLTCCRTRMMAPSFDCWLLTKRWLLPWGMYNDLLNLLYA